MNYETWAAIADTPWWIFAFFIYLIWLGFESTAPRIVSLKSLFVLPTIFLLLSLVTLFFTFELTTINLFTWQGTTLFGMMIGFFQCRLVKMKAIKGKNAFYFPGTYSLLIILIALFSLKYFWNVNIDFNPLILLEADNRQLLIGIYGLGMGLFIGQCIYALRCLRVGPFLNEENAK